ncbi:hypothetical protein GCM10007423_12130 [Dyadobacter endophyticus]|uniref:Uncharacterized protein n=1 Tax=Dyadobacter endophyticus TaxID=1749036 RepID=A0ABQ1YJ38_9BACT|nr:hypothetical protein [Dyadobacter endophyticus]GGH26840.1 hypothetical protein GCM10007423_12130 [Dyadobacter endophyticus]
MENLGINPSQSYNAEVTQALQEILVFFQPGDLEYLRVDLWHWLKAVTGDKPFLFRGEPSTVISLWKQLTKMIDTGRLILDTTGIHEDEKQRNSFSPFSEEQIAKDFQYMREIKQLTAKYNGTIRRLSLSESEQPVLALKRFFEAYSQDDWTQILEDWVEYGLSKMSICEATGECNEVHQYELLEALAEAFSLILKAEQGGCPLG